MKKNLQHECGNTGIYRGKLCQPKGRIGVVQVTGQKFDMKLSLHNATLNDAGVYTVRVKVVSPDRSKEFSLTKTFQVHMIGKSCVSQLAIDPVGRITTLMYIKLIIDLNSNL